MYVPEWVARAFDKGGDWLGSNCDSYGWDGMRWDNSESREREREKTSERQKIPPQRSSGLLRLLRLS